MPLAQHHWCAANKRFWDGVKLASIRVSAEGEQPTTACMKEVHLDYGIYYRSKIAKLWQEVKTYSPAEPLKAGQCPCWAAAELVRKRTADKLYNLLPNESLWIQILAGNPFKPLHFLKWSMGPEIHFYVSVKHGLHESRSIPGYWLRTGVHSRDMLTSGPACTARIHRATTALLSHSSAGHMLEMSMLHTLTSAIQCHTAVLHRPQTPILVQNLSPPASSKSLPVEEALPISSVPVLWTKAAVIIVRVPCESPVQLTFLLTRLSLKLSKQSCRSGWFWACAHVHRWSGAEGGRSKGTLVTSFNSPASAALCAACGKLERSFDATPGLAFCITASLANALCYSPASARQFWRLALGQDQSLLNSNQTWEMHWLGPKVGPAAPSSSVLPVWLQ